MNGRGFVDFVLINFGAMKPSSRPQYQEQTVNGFYENYEELLAIMGHLVERFEALGKLAHLVRIRIVLQSERFISMCSRAKIVTTRKTA